FFGPDSWIICTHCLWYALEPAEFIAAFSFPSAPTVRSFSPKLAYPERNPGWMVAHEREPRTPMPYGPPRSLVSLAAVSDNSARFFGTLTLALSNLFRLEARLFSS